MKRIIVFTVALLPMWGLAEADRCIRAFVEKPYPKIYEGAKTMNWDQPQLPVFGLDNEVVFSHSGSGRSHRLKIPGFQASSRWVSADGNSAIVSTYKGYSLVTGLSGESPTVRELSDKVFTPSKLSGGDTSLSSDGKWILSRVYQTLNNGAQYTFTITNLENGEEKTGVGALPYSADHSFFVGGKPNHFVILNAGGGLDIDVGSGSVKPFPVSEELYGSDARTHCPMNNRWVSLGRANGTSFLTLYDYKPGVLYDESVKTIRLPGLQSGNSSFHLECTADGKRLFIRGANEVVAVDLERAVILDRFTVPAGSALEKEGFTIKPSPRGKRLLLSPYYSGSPLYLKVGDDGKFAKGPQPGPGELGGGYGWLSDDGIMDRAFLRDIETICAYPQHDDPRGVCVAIPMNPLPLPEEFTAWLKDTTLKTACEQEFSAEVWDKITEVPLEEEGMSEEQLRLFLLRFQKPGGLSLKKHLRILVTLFTSDLVEKEPDLVAGVLERLWILDSYTYEFFLAQIPGLGRINPNASFKNPCRSEDETNYIRDVFTDRIRQNPSLALKEMLPISRPFKQLPEDEKRKLHTQVTENLRNEASGDYYLKGIFPSLLYYLAHDASAPLFGVEPYGVTGLTFIRNESRIDPVIVGGTPFGNATKMKHGFYLKRIGTSMNFKGPDGKVTKEVVSGSVLWRQQGHEFTGTIDLHPLESTDLVSNEKAPNYSSLWQDKKLNGAIIVGSNLKSKSVGLLDEYLEYYQDQGFKFEKTPVKIADTKAFLAEKISSGEWDYFLKEAHSDGDDLNLFRIDRESETITGKKKLPNGKEENVTLIYPKDNSGNQMVIPNFEFAQWIQDRDKKKQGPLVYFNTSCGSTNKAVREIESARSKSLIVIAGKNSLTTFVNSPNAPLRMVLTGFREGKSYQEIRDRLKTNEDYAKGKQNGYLFPDESEYQSMVTEKVFPFEVRVEMTKDGKPYVIDQAIRHE